MKRRLLRITTVPQSLLLLLHGQLEYMEENGFNVLAVSASGPEVSLLKQKRIEHQVVEMTRKITPVRDFLSLIQLIRVIRKFNPDIVHTHTPKAGLLGMLAAWYAGVPIRLHTVAGLPLMESTGFKRRILIAAEYFTYASSTAILPNSEGLKNFILNNFATQRNKVKVIGRGSSNGIDTDYFQNNMAISKEASEVRRVKKIPDDAIVFSFVGRIVKDKGIVELVRAFKKLLARGGRLPYLLLVGAFEDDLDPIPTEELEFLKSNTQVILAGFQRDVRPWLKASDVFVFPSYREGFPNVVMQACCMELPCVVSDINGCNEIIHHNLTGIIVPPKKMEPLYDAMITLEEDAGLRKKYGVSAREEVVKNFDQRYLWKALMEEYQINLSNCTPHL